MTPQQSAAIRSAIAEISRLADQLPSAQPLPKAACELAAASLDFANACPTWVAGHEFIRDCGVTRWRDSAAGECARAMQIVAAGLRSLSVHRIDASRDDNLAERLDATAKALATAIEELGRCEEALKDRIAEPRLAQLDLEQRRRNLMATPTSSKDALLQLSRKLEEQQRIHTQATALEQSLASQLKAATEALARTNTLVAATKSEIASVCAQHDSLELASKAADAEVRGRRRDLQTVEANLQEVRQQLEALRSDPRQSIADAVQRALLELPADAFDRSAGHTK